ncbi:MAG TPA: class I SAM-dependent methyltransferase [Steroidobacteraceae bacterium]|nr:class I SAM-dependent methyltransferase [Steroidobacteraceae bacterium]
MSALIAHGATLGSAPLADHLQKPYHLVAEMYDFMEHPKGEGETPITNRMLVERFKKLGTRTILDMTCGTGNQTIPLRRAGFEVIGTDLNEAMLKVARRKGASLGIEFRQADMRTVSVGRFDAIISMYNAIGHLSCEDFERTARNAFEHLNPGGTYAFDIFNTAVVETMQEHEIIDSVAVRNDTKYVRFTRFRYDGTRRHVVVGQRTYIQKRYQQSPETIDESYSLQTYRKSQLEDVLRRSGFSAVSISGDGMQDVFGIPGVCHFAIATKA